jgi:hypothetical protein
MTRENPVVTVVVAPGEGGRVRAVTFAERVARHRAIPFAYFPWVWVAGTYLARAMLGEMLIHGFVGGTREENATRALELVRTWPEAQRPVCGRDP